MINDVLVLSENLLSKHYRKSNVTTPITNSALVGATLEPGAHILLEKHEKVMFALYVPFNLCVIILNV